MTDESKKKLAEGLSIPILYFKNRIKNLIRYEEGEITKDEYEETSNKLFDDYKKQLDTFGKDNESE